MLMGQFLKIRLDRGDGHSTGNGHRPVPQLLISRSSEKVMSGPCDREKIGLLIPLARYGTPIGWEEHCRAIGKVADNETGLMHQHHVLTNRIGVCGWIFRETIALVKQQKVSDYVHVSLHGVTIQSVLIVDELISGFTIEI